MNLSCINLSLNNVEDWHVFSFFGWSTHHDIWRMEQSSHNVKNWSLFDIWNLFLNGERCVSSHQEMTSWSWNQRGQKTCHIIVHITRISKRSSWSCHNSWYEWVNLTEVGIRNFESLRSNFIKSSIIQNNNRISIVDQSFEGQYRVVWLNDHIWTLLLIGKNRVSRY